VTKVAALFIGDPALLILFALGALFGATNACQSRILNNGTKRRFPDWLVAGSVLIVAICYGLAMRGVANSSGFSTILAYGVGQACGVIAGARFANGPLFDRFHPNGVNK
jgi:amino acid transporter